MATQQDLQELLRLLTVGRKVPMMQAMTQIKALQAADLMSIKQIAEAPLETVQAALKDDKGARPLQNACKAALKRGASTATGKREASDTAAPQAKRTKTDLFMTGPVEMTPQELEKSLELPLCTDEELIAQAAIETNRAPLVLAFAVELLRHTMPEQPLSSRLSLAQAVVSANSRSKAVSIGLDKGPSADEAGWGEGQPRVKVLGREIAVLKRGGYEWRGEETVGEEGTDVASTSTAPSTATLTQSDTPTQTSWEKAAATATATPTPTATATATTTATPTPVFDPTPKSTWSTSQPLTLKSSTFIARATHITHPSERKTLLASLFNSTPSLKTATHNAWAYRLRPTHEPAPSSATPLQEVFYRSESHDDGESGAGALLLRVLRDAGAVDTLLVMTRWYGGIMLGPDRWRLMRACAGQALGERMRKRGGEVRVGGEAVWGLDLEGARTAGDRGVAAGENGSGMGGGGGGGGGGTGVVGMPIHKPEGARNYLLRSFNTATVPPITAAATAPGEDKKEDAGKRPKKAPKTQKAMEAEREQNLGLLLGALRLLFDSWADHLDAAELDRRAWGWYVAVRPDVESGQAGWGAKGTVRLSDVLKLRRPGS